MITTRQTLKIEIDSSVARYYPWNIIQIFLVEHKIFESNKY